MGIFDQPTINNATVTRDILEAAFLTFLRQAKSTYDCYQLFVISNPYKLKQNEVLTKFLAENTMGLVQDDIDFLLSIMKSIINGIQPNKIADSTPVLAPRKTTLDTVVK
jgi:hypothetical protein